MRNAARFILVLLVLQTCAIAPALGDSCEDPLCEHMLPRTLPDSNTIDWTWDALTRTYTAEVSSLSPFDTDDLAEGSNLYYTDGRADARISSWQAGTLPGILADYALLDGSNGPTTGVWTFGDDLRGPQTSCSTETTFTLNSGAAHCATADCKAANGGAELDAVFGPCGGETLVISDEAGGEVTVVCGPLFAAADIIAGLPTTFTYGVDDLTMCVLAGSIAGGGAGDFISVLLPSSDSCLVFATAMGGGAGDIIDEDLTFITFDYASCAYQFTPAAGWSLAAGWPNPITFVDDSAPTYRWTLDAGTGDIVTTGDLSAVDATLTGALDVTGDTTLLDMWADQGYFGNYAVAENKSAFNASQEGTYVAGGTQYFIGSQFLAFTHSQTGAASPAKTIGVVAYANTGNSTDNLTDAITGAVTGGYWQAEHTGSGTAALIRGAEFRITTYGAASGNVTRGVALMPQITQESGSTSAFGDADYVLVREHVAPGEITGNQVGYHVEDLHQGGTNYGLKVEVFTDPTNDWGIHNQAPSYLGTDRVFAPDLPAETGTTQSVCVGSDGKLYKGECDHGDLEVGSANALYFGPSGTDGTWRIVRSGNNLAFERRESGNYVTKLEAIP